MAERVPRLTLIPVNEVETAHFLRGLVFFLERNAGLFVLDVSAAVGRGFDPHCRLYGAAC